MIMGIVSRRVSRSAFYLFYRSPCLTNAATTLLSELVPAVMKPS